MTAQYSYADVKKHNDNQSTWIVIHNNIYAAEAPDPPLSGSGGVWGLAIAGLREVTGRTTRYCLRHHVPLVLLLLVVVVVG
jgi:hypothetical protein